MLETVVTLAALFALPLAILLSATAANDVIVALRRRRAPRRRAHPYGPR